MIRRLKEKMVYPKLSKLIQTFIDEDRIEPLNLKERNDRQKKNYREMVCKYNKRRF